MVESIFLVAWFSDEEEQFKALVVPQQPYRQNHLSFNESVVEVICYAISIYISNDSLKLKDFVSVDSFEFPQINHRKEKALRAEIFHGNLRSHGHSCRARQWVV